MLTKKLAANLRKFRKKAGLTQEELARKLGKTSNVISNWERGDNRPDADTIERICSILKVSPNDLLGWEEEKDDITVAAHIEGDELTNEEKEEIQSFIQYVLSKRKK